MFQHGLSFEDLFLCYVYGCFAVCMYVCAPHACWVPTEARWCLISWYCSLEGCESSHGCYLSSPRRCLLHCSQSHIYTSEAPALPSLLNPSSQVTYDFTVVSEHWHWVVGSNVNTLPEHCRRDHLTNLASDQQGHDVHLTKPGFRFLLSDKDKRS